MSEAETKHLPSLIFKHDNYALQDGYKKLVRAIGSESRVLSSVLQSFTLCLKGIHGYRDCILVGSLSISFCDAILHLYFASSNGETILVSDADWERRELLSVIIEQCSADLSLFCKLRSLVGRHRALLVQLVNAALAFALRHARPSFQQVRVEEDPQRLPIISSSDRQDYISFCLSTMLSLEDSSRVEIRQHFLLLLSVTQAALICDLPDSAGNILHEAFKLYENLMLEDALAQTKELIAVLWHFPDNIETFSLWHRLIEIANTHATMSVPPPYLTKL